MRLIDKVRFHIKDVAWSMSLKYMFYRILELVNRRIPLPNSAFKYNITEVYHEKYLEKYMYPRNNGCFIDVGANVGYWTTLVAKRGYEVIAFEPSPRPYQILKTRVKHYSNVKVYPIALGERSGIGVLRLYKSFSDYATMGTLDENPQRGVEASIGKVKVPVRTLDSFNFLNVGLIKIDTEGFEVPVLHGAQETIRRCQPRLIVEAHHPPYDKEMRRIIEVLESLDYHYIVERKKGIGYDIYQPHIIGDSTLV